MAPRDSSAEPERRRRRDSGTDRKRHHKRRRSSNAQQLSIDALAQLNEYNTRGIVPEPEPVKHADRRRRRERDGDTPRRGEYSAVDTEYESPRNERRRRDEHRDSDGDYHAERRERRRRRASEHDPTKEKRRKSRRPEAAGIEQDADRSKSRKRDHHYYSDRGNDSPREERRRKKRYAAEDTEYDSAHSQRRERRRHRGAYETEDDDGERPRRGHHGRKKSRVVSGAIVEEGRAAGHGLRGGRGNRTTVSSYDSIDQEKETVQSKSRWPWANRSWKPTNKKKKRWIIAGCVLVVLLIVIIVAATVSKKKSEDNDSGPDKSNLGDVSQDSIPTKDRGSYLDPFTWYDTKDFNVTYTDETVGDLPVMGLFTEWDDSKAANDKVPPLNKPWGDYAKKPARGVSVGGWLGLEPFITPSFFNYDSRLGIIDEWTVCKHLGPRKTAETLEKHYATFVTEQTFEEIRDAGLDHVRIPFQYWAVVVYDDDPYLFRTSWRYLLRGIEWARKNGLRVKLDLHGLPGSQNGWNHSGKWGAIGWLNGTDGSVNRQRSLEVHDRLSKFFAQDRYRNIVTFYGLANEPRMVDLPADSVVDWTTEAYDLVKKNGVRANVVFGDGFMGLEKWQGRMTGRDDLVLDVHQYVIFNDDLIVLSHQDKVRFACKEWSKQADLSMDTSTGYGPTMFAEWSQADTDCAKHLTNVGWGNRWEGTYEASAAAAGGDGDGLGGGNKDSTREPHCPERDSSCKCDAANNPDASSLDAEYKKFLKMFAEAQMTSFERGWGWWYWTWDTEDAPLWSYKKGRAAGILPQKAYEKDFDCTGDVPDFGSNGLSESY